VRDGEPNIHETKKSSTKRLTSSNFKNLECKKIIKATYVKKSKENK